MGFLWGEVKAWAGSPTAYALASTEEGCAGTQDFLLQSAAVNAVSTTFTPLLPLALLLHF